VVDGNIDRLAIDGDSFGASMEVGFVDVEVIDVEAEEGDVDDNSVDVGRVVDEDVLMAVETVVGELLLTKLVA
jgi:hypothetical protein